ncbi:hypothetical protein [Litorilituus sediminis]|uniref:Extensin family protein n=1 Tax=Litorilituus sediminis TaxID=718192 RepID=A0A4P6P093_9GAMM|nr:hypothetical protein [Litorilituus sediminis]QBG34446.1 hypothetical protein EMK97_01185 [Litorilituus sediminis]
MASIPQSINGVTVRHANSANLNVEQALLTALQHCIKKDIAKGFTLSQIYISSANDSHKFPSRHVQGKGKAVDISRINGKKMSVSYGTDKEVTAIVDAMQQKFESAPGRRENFGPSTKKKLGSAHSVSGHKDHIHFSVN